MTKVNAFVVALAAGMALGAASAHAAGNAENGAKMFRNCTACHTIKAGEPNRVGPNLHGMFDRPAGKTEKFNYSPGLAKADFKWDDEKLEKWLENPQALIPGARMAFKVSNKEQREDVIAYLRGATK